MLANLKAMSKLLKQPRTECEVWFAFKELTWKQI